MSDLDLKINNILKEIVSLKSELYKKEKEMEELQFEKYDSCNHLFIISNVDKDEYEGRSYFYYRCIKCGLNTEVKKIHSLTFEESIMYLYLIEHNFKISGTYIELDYNFNKARSLWMQIQKENNNISDDILLKVFIEKISENIKQDISKVKVREKHDFSSRNIWDYP